MCERVAIWFVPAVMFFQAQRAAIPKSRCDRHLHLTPPRRVESVRYRTVASMDTLASWISEPVALVNGYRARWLPCPGIGSDISKTTKRFDENGRRPWDRSDCTSSGLAQIVDGVYEQQAALFGLSTPPASITLTVWAMTGGGLSEGMSGIDIYAAASAAGQRSYDLGQARYVFAQESAEVCMRAQKGGWYPSDSKGEALSRFLGELAFPGSAVKYGYATSQSWVNQVDRGDWVTHNENNDTTDYATGCAILFLNYMTSQLAPIKPMCRSISTRCR